MADAKLTALATATGMKNTDLMYVVDDVGGTPTSKKITLANFKKGISKYDATVGINGNYSDIQAAITGVGGTDIKLLLISDVTEDSDITVPTGLQLFIDLGSNVLTMNDYDFKFSGIANINIQGAGVNTNAKIKWASTDNNYMIDCSSYPTSSVVVSGFTFENNSTATSSYLSHGVQKIFDMKIKCANVNGSGLYFNEGCSMASNICISGGGSSCSSTFSIYGESVIDNIIFTDTFSSTFSGFTISEECTLSNIINTSSQLMVIGCSNGRINIDNCTSIGYGIKFYIDTPLECNITNCSLDSNSFIDCVNSYNTNISNVICDKIDLTDASCHNISISNVRLTSLLDIYGDRIKVSNCELLGGATIQSDADDNGFSNCQFGADAGGGSNTLTIASGANRTRVVGCMSDAAISDSGTDTELAANTIY